MFWFNLLSPLADMGTLERDHVLRELSSRSHHHPHLGKHFVERSTLYQQYQRVRNMNMKSLQERLQELRAAAAEDVTAETPLTAPEPTVAEDDSPMSIAEEMFWFRLLGAVRDLPEAMHESELAELSGRPHDHPLEGNRLYSSKALRREFEWVKRADIDTLQERWNDATLSKLSHETDASDAIDENLRPALEEPVDALFDEAAGDDGAGAERP